MSKFMQRLKEVVKPQEFFRSHDYYYEIPMHLDSERGKEFIGLMGMTKAEIENEIQDLIATKTDKWPANIVIDNLNRSYHIYTGNT